jgi:hypothetical protein
VSRRSNAEIALPTVDHSGHQCTGPQILKSKDRTAVGCCWRVPRAMMLVAALMLLLATVPHPAASAGGAPPPPPPPPHCGGDVFTLTKLDLSAPKTAPEAPRARCLDGSLPAYSFRPGRGAGAKKLLIYLQGGGWCTSSAQCYNRSVGRGGQDRTLGSTATLLPCSPIVDYYEGAAGLRSRNRSISAWADWSEAYFHCECGAFRCCMLLP